MTRLYGAYREFDGFPADAFTEMSDEEQHEAMWEWFHAHFEDPANQTPYESAEGGYIYIWGGPYDARDQIGNEFYEVVPQEVMDRVIERIQRDGWEWAGFVAQIL